MIFDKLWTRRNEHRTDADIKAEIYDTFRGYAALHLTKPRIEVEVGDGAVTLRGVVLGGGQRGMAEKLAAEIDGVKLVSNEILDDPTIEGHVARVLSIDPKVQISTRVVRIKSCNGVVTLLGPVQTQAQQMAAEAATRNVAGVIDVINRLVVTPGKNGHHG